MNGVMDRWTDGQEWIDRLTHRWSDGRRNGLMDGQRDAGRMDGRSDDGWMDEERKNGWMDGQRDGWHVTACLVISSTFNHCLRMCVSFSSHLRGVWCHTRKKRRLDRS